MSVNTFDAMREKMKEKVITVEAVAVEKYRLTVTGIVTYPPNDSELRDLLLSDNDIKRRLPEALQELEEEATDVKITLEKVGK
jgi:hypothetical protein